MTDWTPTTAQVRASYVGWQRNAFIASTAEHEAEFDRWLSAHDGEIRAHERDTILSDLAEGEQ